MAPYEVPRAGYLTATPRLPTKPPASSPVIGYNTISAFIYGLSMSYPYREKIIAPRGHCGILASKKSNKMQSAKIKKRD
jgi:hypothetical protein